MSSSGSKDPKQRDKKKVAATTPSGTNLGEGNVQADQNYRRETREFIEEGKVDEAAAHAVYMTEAEEKAALAAEAKGKARAKS